MRHLQLLFWALSIFPLATPSAAAPQWSDSELNLGAQAYRQARYEEAIEHFKRAVQNNPDAAIPHLYLATAYAQQYIPGADLPENNQLAQLAIEQYNKVLEIEPTNVNSVKGIAYLDLQMKKFDEAKRNYRRAADLDTQDPEAFYSIGVIDWTQTYQPRQELRAKLKMKPQQTLINRPECWQLRDANLDLVEEGIEVLQKSLELRPDYDDAMAYMNLMYRERADIRCGDSKANAADLRTADKWVDKTIAVKKAKAQSQDRQTSSPEQ